MNNKSNRFSPEVRERAVRMVQEHRGEHPSLWAAMESISAKIGCVPQTLHEWVRKHEVDAGTRPGVTRDERERVKTLVFRFNKKFTILPFRSQTSSIGSELGGNSSHQCLGGYVV